MVCLWNMICDICSDYTTVTKWSIQEEKADFSHYCFNFDKTYLCLFYIFTFNFFCSPNEFSMQKPEKIKFTFASKNLLFHRIPEFQIQSNSGLCLLSTSIVQRLLLFSFRKSDKIWHNTGLSALENNNDLL